MDSRLLLPVNTVLGDSYRIARMVGSGGFGITYEAEDINLGTTVAIKEYYPDEFGDRDSTMSVRPKSDRHKKTFEWGRASFLQEARTLARFEHPSIVRVTRVFEANSTAYMVMRFEQGKSFEDWLWGLDRPPTQEELNFVIAPLLDALQMMHAADFLHRDIAPDNIIIRTDGTPVLLDFGAARSAIAAISRSLTGIIKAGYSPHEQYSSDGRLQGPWSDIYAFGGTLYRAVTGKAPVEATLRFDEDRMIPAAQAANGRYRRDFLRAIDTCLKVRHSERPQSVTQLRPMLLGAKSQPKRTEPPVDTYKAPTTLRSAKPQRASTLRQVARRWPAIAATVAVVAGAYGGSEYQRWSLAESAKLAGATTQRQAALDAERRQREKEASDARQRQIEIEEARRRKELADAAEARSKATAEAKRKDEERIAALEEARRKEEADAETNRIEHRIAALEQKRKDDERVQLAPIPNDDRRAEFVVRVQALLKHSRCYDGALTGRSIDAQEGANKFVVKARERGRAKPARIELAKATVSDFESWLKDADAIKDGLCVPKIVPVPAKRQQPEPAAKVHRPRQEREVSRPRYAPSETPSYQGGGGGVGPLQGVR